MVALQYLVKIKGLDFTISDFARNTKMTRAALYKIWKDFLDNEIIIKTREIGLAKLYKLNEKNEVTKAFLNLYKKLLIKMVENKEKEMEVLA